VLVATHAAVTRIIATATASRHPLHPIIVIIVIIVIVVIAGGRHYRYYRFSRRRVSRGQPCRVYRLNLT